MAFELLQGLTHRQKVTNFAAVMHRDRHRILVFGAGVIGSFYATLFAAAGEDVSLLARGRRLEQLRSRRDINVLDRVDDSDLFDFVFVAVRSNQMISALEALHSNGSETFVTLANSDGDYASWEEAVGKGRLLPAFPGAGGSIDSEGVLRAKLTPRWIQPTVFGEIDGCRTERSSALGVLFRKAGIPSREVRDISAWQRCHLGLVVPLADAYVLSETPDAIWKDRQVVRQTALALRSNMNNLRREGVRLDPVWLHCIRLLPSPFVTCFLSKVFASRFASVFMHPHAISGREEMTFLHELLYSKFECLRKGNSPP